MSINWVMLDQQQGFVRLPGEQPVWKSPARTSLAITTPRSYPGNNPVALNSNAGTVYLTNQRIVYLPSTPTDELQSFSAPLLNLHDTHMTVPFFGPNAWQAVLQPVPGGNIPAIHATIEVKMVFKEGGAPDFHSHFERIKERLQQAVEAARHSGSTNEGETRNGVLVGINMEAVHLDELPAYEPLRQDTIASPQVMSYETAARARDTDAELRRDPDRASSVRPGVLAPRTTHQQPPTEEPPGYEETQQQSLQQELDRRLSEGLP